MPEKHGSLCSVTIENLSVTKGSDKLLDQINMELRCGELTALIGTNGAGKTTLLRSILGEVRHEGTVSHRSHDGSEIKEITVGYIPQFLDFDRSTPVSVTDFLLAGRKGSRPVCFGQNKMTRKAVLSEMEEAGCLALADRTLGRLSGGELQRVMLIQALNPTPDLLILDEPVSGVDRVGSEKFYKTVASLKETRHIAIAMVSHDLDLVRKYADKVILLRKQVLKKGTPDEVFASDEFKEAFFGGLME